MSLSSFKSEQHVMNDEHLIGGDPMNMMNSKMMKMDDEMETMKSTMLKVNSERDPEKRNLYWIEHRIQMKQHMSEMSKMVGMLKTLMGTNKSERFSHRKNMQLMMGKMQTMMEDMGYLVDRNLMMCVRTLE